jgi:hypothetical protein
VFLLAFSLHSTFEKKPRMQKGADNNGKLLTTFRNNGGKQVRNVSDK